MKIEDDSNTKHCLSTRINPKEYKKEILETRNLWVQSTGAVEYGNCISAEGLYSCNKCPRYDIKQSDGEAPVMLEL